MKLLSFRIAGLLLLAMCLSLSSLAQLDQEVEVEPEVMRGYLFQNGITPESFLITNEEELKAFVGSLPPYTPYKNLPQPPNPDPFLKGFTVDFEVDLIAVAVEIARARIGLT